MKIIKWIQIVGIMDLGKELMSSGIEIPNGTSLLFPFTNPNLDADGKAVPDIYVIGIAGEDTFVQAVLEYYGKDAHLILPGLSAAHDSLLKNMFWLSQAVQPVSIGAWQPTLPISRHHQDDPEYGDGYPTHTDSSLPGFPR